MAKPKKYQLKNYQEHGKFAYDGKTYYHSTLTDSEAEKLFNQGCSLIEELPPPKSKDSTK